MSIRTLPVLLFLLSLIFSSCKKEEPLSCELEAQTIRSGVPFGNYDDEYVHYATFPVGEEEVCVITHNAIRIISLATSEVSYDQLDITIWGAEVTAHDTILHWDNSFVRFFPSTRQFEHIYTPPFRIDDFCVTPDHGIGYFWNTLFVEPSRFNYFEFKTGENRSLFYYQDFIEDSPYPYYDYQTFYDGENLELILRTDNKNQAFTDQGVFYRIDVNAVEITERKEYQDKGSMEIFEFQSDGTMAMSYAEGYGRYAVSLFNPFTQRETKKQSFENDFTRTKVFVDENRLTVLSFVHRPHEFQHFDWRQGQTKFTIVGPEELTSAFARVRHFDQWVLLYNQRKNEAVLYDEGGCAAYKINTKKDIQHVVFAKGDQILIQNADDEFEVIRF